MSIYFQSYQKKVAKSQVNLLLSDIENPTKEDIEKTLEDVKKITDFKNRQKQKEITTALLDVVPEEKLNIVLSDVLEAYFFHFDEDLKNIKWTPTETQKRPSYQIFERRFTDYEKDFSCILALSDGLKAAFFIECFEVIFLCNDIQYLKKPSSKIVVSEAIKGYELIGGKQHLAFAQRIQNEKLSEIVAYLQYQNVREAEKTNELLNQYIQANKSEFVLAVPQ